MAFTFISVLFLRLRKHGHGHCSFHLDDVFYRVHFAEEDKLLILDVIHELTRIKSRAKVASFGLNCGILEQRTLILAQLTIIL